MAKIDVTKTIGDDSFQFLHISARKRTRIMIRLGKLIGKPMAAAISSTDDNFDINAIVEALLLVADEAAVDRIIDDIFQQTIWLGHGALMHGNTMDELPLGTMWKALFAGLEVYFGDFLEDALALTKGGFNNPLTKTEN